MSAFIDITGKKYNLLVAVRLSQHRTSAGKIQWFCQCDCGNTVLVEPANLKNGNTKSCGCLKKKRNHERFLTHGLSETPTYKAWCDMKARCCNPKQKDYKNYGGRGIEVCDRWLNSFESFLDDMGTRPAQRTLDRIDVNGDYEPGNCRWATASQQARNKRQGRGNRFVEFQGQNLTIAEWSERTGLSESLIRYRLRAGWAKSDVFCKSARKLEDHLTFQGKTRTKAQWCQIMGLTQNTLLGRLRRGWSVEKALTTPPLK